MSDWIPLFTKYFKDEQILNPAYAMTFDHCKLCDKPVKPSEQKAHLAQHRRELRAWRNRQDAIRKANLAKARKARAK